MGFFDKLLAGLSKQDDDKDSYNSDNHRGTKDKRSFEEKLLNILEYEGSSYELQRNISIEELKQEFGDGITRNGNCCAPENITYMICKNGARVMYIRVWDDDGIYGRVANRQIGKYFKENGIVCLDFFTYMPNDFDYMMERIREKLA